MIIIKRPPFPLFLEWIRRITYPLVEPSRRRYFALKCGQIMSLETTQNSTLERQNETDVKKWIKTTQWRHYKICIVVHAQWCSFGKNVATGRRNKGDIPVLFSPRKEIPSKEGGHGYGNMYFGLKRWRIKGFLSRWAGTKANYARHCWAVDAGQRLRSQAKFMPDRTGVRAGPHSGDGAKLRAFHCLSMIYDICEKKIFNFPLL